jgi:hypothetical protein
MLFLARTAPRRCYCHVGCFAYVLGCFSQRLHSKKKKKTDI